MTQVALRATSDTGTHQPVQRRALHRRSLPARPARRLRAQRRPMWRASQRCCFKQRCCVRFLAANPTSAHRQRECSAPIFLACRPFHPIASKLSTAHLLLLRRLPPPLSSRHARPHTCLLRCYGVSHCVQNDSSSNSRDVATGLITLAMAIAGAACTHTHPAAATARRQMQPGVAQKLLPTAVFPHDVLPITARAA